MSACQESIHMSSQGECGHAARVDVSPTFHMWLLAVDRSTGLEGLWWSYSHVWQFANLWAGADHFSSVRPFILQQTKLVSFHGGIRAAPKEGKSRNYMFSGSPDLITHTSLLLQSKSKLITRPAQIQWGEGIKFTSCCCTTLYFIFFLFQWGIIDK